MTTGKLTKFIFAAVFFISMGLFRTSSSIASDFWANDRLHLPDYGASTNLILNPSFEAGMRYWGFPCFAGAPTPLQYYSFFAIDGNEARSGSHSLRMRALSLKNPLPLGMLTVPLVANITYTLSFYAKGSLAVPLKLNVLGRGWEGQLFSTGVTVNNQWQRFTVSFNENETFASVYFDAQTYTAGQEGYIWLDDVQLEQGSATTFVQSPVAAQLVSVARGNFLEFGQEPNFNLIVRSVPSTNGTASISVEDFFFNNVFTETYQFTTNSAGESTISLDDLSDAVVASDLHGVFVVTGVFNISGVSRPYTDYFRFSVMDFLDNTHKNKDLFNLTYVYQLQSGGPEMARFLERERTIGFGSINYDFGSFGNDLDYGLDSERMQLIEEYGFGYMGRPVLQHGCSEISEANGLYKMVDVNGMTNPSSQNLVDFTNICRIKALNRPWNNIWWFCGESNPGCWPLANYDLYPDAFAKFLIATNQGIKAGDPNAKVLIEGGPWKLDATSTGWVERYIQDTNRIDPTVQFDGAAAHHYRNFPENPDLDADVAAFLTMLDRNGHENWPFYINEGGNYCPLNIPEEGISPYIMHSGNAWYMGPLSYHSGRAERISAAFSARNWLVALKYQNRLACMEDFSTPNRYVDIDFTPRFYEKIPNTLGRILGDASFVKDIVFALYCRGYLFEEDATGSPIAVIWGYKESVDRWQESPPNYTFDFGSQNLQFVDLMENEVNYPQDCDGRTVIPLSPFPMFIKGMPGTEDQLCNAIARGVAAMIVIMDGTLHNGSLTATSAGTWYNTPAAVPAGWAETLSGCAYQAAYQFTILAGSGAHAYNNTTVEKVKANHQYKVSASLGGIAGAIPKVKVYATQNSDGTGTKVLLAEVSRLSGTGEGYTLYPVTGIAGSPVSPSLVGYYIQVWLDTPGYYDNVVVTSDVATDMVAVMDGDLSNGTLTALSAGYWYNTPAAVPAGWAETLLGCVYQAAYQFTILAGSGAHAYNNTGELVQTSYQYTVSAFLGGVVGNTPTVKVYATQNSDGTGTKVLLAEVSRLSGTGEGYTLYPMLGVLGSPTSSSLAGYYIQVWLDTPGYYDNIVVNGVMQ